MTSCYDENYYDQYDFGFASTSRVDHQGIIKCIAVPEPVVLDIGCGLGTLLTLIDTPRHNKFGVESNKYAVAECVNKGFNVCLHTDISALPFEDAKFDVVIMNEVIEHLHDPQSALCGIRRVLKTSGKLIITTPNKNFFVKNLDTSHVSEMTLKELRYLIISSGFDVSLHEVRGFNVFDFLGRKLIFPAGKFLNRYKSMVPHVSAIRESTDAGFFGKFRTSLTWFGSQQLLVGTASDVVKE